jgi:hypothetical protein
MSKKFVPVTDPLQAMGIYLFPLQLPISGDHAGVYGGVSLKLPTIDRMDDKYYSRSQTLTPMWKGFASSR